MQWYEKKCLEEKLELLLNEMKNEDLHDKIEFTTCLDCQAKSHVAILESLNFDNENSCVLGYMEKLKEALVFVLENTDWPVGD